ncbi:hypothetical protein L2E82_31212 [Cichorium intybus]|uniref:Uncharacterized protein n=1 Tax=Cichorium intybus TaxID=13427 RepID=A0ACB9D2M0_CICIN|nr:hypothetical protein L2E82_31212 [Cichorium intybus]
MLGTLEATLARFSVFMDINDDMKDEILLLTRYLIDYFRRFGFVIAADDFVKEANINEEQPLDGSFMEYTELYQKVKHNLDYWTFFWYIKVKAFKQHTFEGKALPITTPNQQPLRVQSYTTASRMHFSPQQSGQDNVHVMHSKEGALLLLHRGIIHRPRKFLYQMLRRIVYDYFGKCGRVRQTDAILVKEL